MDLVDILAHRSSTEGSIVMRLPECGLVFDVTRRREGVRLPVITQSADRCSIHKIGSEILSHRQVWRSQLHQLAAKLRPIVKEVRVEVIMGGRLDLLETQGRAITMLL